MTPQTLTPAPSAICDNNRNFNFGKAEFSQHNQCAGSGFSCTLMSPYLASETFCCQGQRATADKASDGTPVPRHFLAMECVA
jgi:hypothetical protein